MKIADSLAVLEIKTEGRAIYPVFAWDGAHRVLVDTGFPGQEPLFEAALEALGFASSGLTDILLTHQDMDHIGCVKSFIAAAPTCSVLTHWDEAPYLTGEKTPVKLAAMEANLDALPEDRRAFAAQFRRGYENRRLHEVVRLSDGAVLPFCGGIEVIHTPGHTPGHICLYFRRAKVLLTGDALNVSEGRLTGPASQHTQDMALALQSLRKLLAFDAETVVSYHGGVWRGDVRGALLGLLEA